MNAPLSLLVAAAVASGAGPRIPTPDSLRLTLAEALAGALARYPTVAAARAGRDQAAASVGEARASLLPRITLDAQLTRYEEPSIVYPLHGLNLASPPTFDRALAQGSAGLSWTLWDFGGRSSRVRAARAAEGAAEAAVNASEAALIARVTGSYLRVLTLRGVLAAQDQQLAALAAESDRVRQLLAAGRAARVEVLRIGAEESRARADRVGTAAALDVAERDLALLAGVPVGRARAPALVPLHLRDSSQVPDREAVLVRARDASPDLLQARRAADAGRAQATAAGASRYPELRLQGVWMDRGTWQGDFRGEWQAGLQLSYPLFTGGQRTSTIRRAQAEYRVRAEQLRQAEFSLEQAVDRALATVNEAHARVEALAQAEAQFDEVVRIRQLTLRTGSGTQTDYLEAETQLVRARAALVEARHVEIGARVELARVTGELTVEWLNRELEQAGDRPRTTGLRPQTSGHGPQATGLRPEVRGLRSVVTICATED